MKTKLHPGQKIRYANQTTKNVFPLPGIKLSVSDKYASPPAAPAWLTDEARRFWNRHKKKWTENNRLNPQTRDMFAQLCEAWSDWRGFQKLKKDLSGRVPVALGLVTKNGPAVGISAYAKEERNAREHFFKIMKAFEKISNGFEDKGAIESTGYGDAFD